jgi:hypothetical protein
MKIILLTFLFFVGNLSADSFGDANKAYEIGDYEKAGRLMHDSCDDGNMRACWSLGLLYSNGRGVNQDKSRALELYKIACEGGYKNGCISYDIFKEL